MRTSRSSRIVPWLEGVVLLLGFSPTATPAQSAAGKFEVSGCYDVKFFLTNVAGAPSRKMILLLRTRVSGVSKQTATEVLAYRNGCTVNTKCEVFAVGEIQMDAEFSFLDWKRVSGEYVLDLGKKQLRGRFAAERRAY